MAALTYWQRKEKAMKFGKADHRPQDKDGMRFFLLHRRRKSFHIQPQINPNLHRIQAWMPRPHSVPDGFHKQIDISSEQKFRLVDCPESFDVMLDHLYEVEVFALDLEFHDDHSYLGMTSLIQISTYYFDFVLDPFVLIQEIETQLKVIFESEYWIKIMHGCPNDVRNLQRDFGIFIIGVIDTQLMFQKYKSLNAGNMVKFDTMAKEFYSRNELSYLSDNEKSLLTLADYCQRPIPNKLKIYARADVHVLIRVYFQMKIHMTAAEFNSVVVSTNTLLCKHGLTYEPPVTVNFASNPLVHRDMNFKSLCTEQKRILEAIYNWREDLAKRFDEKPEYIIKTPDKIAIIARPLISAEDIQLAVQRYSESFTRWWEAFLKLKVNGQIYYADLLATSCHNCTIAGHCAWGYLEDYSKEHQQRYYANHRASKTIVNRHRR
ncbi:unnamed protein product [Allacma fusca]|uniref:3'-5' exonuclease domain-containing protein n=1 Tax=Allacma fusca TaxID=39272 RepID=A0A8J2LH43_9HEXA|nr:unnamed protein product [Allacma fusca]